MYSRDPRFPVGGGVRSLHQGSTRHWAQVQPDREAGAGWARCSAHGHQLRPAAGPDRGDGPVLSRVTVLVRVGLTSTVTMSSFPTFKKPTKHTFI